MTIDEILEEAYDAGAAAYRDGRNKRNSHHRFFASSVLGDFWWQGFDGKPKELRLHQNDLGLMLEMLSRKAGDAVAQTIPEGFGFGLMLFNFSEKPDPKSDVLTWTSSGNRGDMARAMVDLLQRWDEGNDSDLTPGEAPKPADGPTVFEPEGHRFRCNGESRLLVTAGEYKNWVCRRHLDGQWVTVRKVDAGYAKAVLRLPEDRSEA